MTTTDNPTITTALSPPPGAPSRSRWATEPFVMGSREQFTRLRTWLRSVRFTERELCAAAEVASITHFKVVQSGRTAFSEPIDAQSLLVLLFLDGKLFPWEVIRSLLSSEEQSILTDLGLLQPAVADAALCAATVAVIPIENIYVVSDRLITIEKVGEGLPPDLVYSPRTPQAHRFIGLMPRVACDSYLELCGGTGIAALLAARQFARHAVSADITDRSTRFARFNAALNDLENFSAVCGDLYEAVPGQTFDLITAHPPYVPAAETQMVFRDGGADGEQVTRRIIAGLDEHLRPGGLFYLDALMTDRVGTLLEHRIRGILGPSEGEFDVVVARGASTDPRDYVTDRLRSRRITAEGFLSEGDFFTQAGIEGLVASTVLIQRRATARPVVTSHRMLSGQTTAEHLQWLVRYLVATANWGPEEVRRLLDARPRALPQTMLLVRSSLNDGAWESVDLRIVAAMPFAVESPCPNFLPAFLGRCDGRVTVREHFARLCAEGLIPEGRSDDDFAQLVRELADGPYIELDLLPFSPTASTASGNPPGEP